MTTTKPLIATRGKPLKGRARIPGDKSISHRALIFGALALGETRIEGLLEAEDVGATASALCAMGALITTENGVHSVCGVGVGGLRQPSHGLEMGNSGTSTRLLLGLVAGHDMEVRFSGDASLSRRPMGRVLEPLSAIGARVTSADGDTLPLTLKGARDPLPITYRLPVPSAQVKSAILLAGLNAPGVTTVIEPEATRDHTERMLARFGAELAISTDAQGARHIALTGRPELQPCAIEVPGDPSSAAFLVVAGLIVPGSDIVVENVMMNPTRSGLIETLREMGGEIDLLAEREAGGEPVADIRVRASRLHGVDVPARRAPSMIDEYPVLAMAAAFASGSTHMAGLAELRVKESDRLAAIGDILAGAGVEARAGADDLIVVGSDGEVAGGCEARTLLDHRLAMSALVMGLATDNPVAIDDSTPIGTSFTGFADIMRGLGASIAPGSGAIG